MMGARLDFRASFRIVSTVALGVMILFHGAFTVFGHHCGEPQITVEVGRTVAYRITADLSESQASHYNLSINSDPAIAVASPDNFDAFNYGEFTIRGVSPGTNRFVFEWSYAPNQASGFCVVEVFVVPRGSTTQTAANQPQSGQAGDPVNTLTGEFLLQEMPDLQLYGPMPLYFSRYYASGLQMDGQAHGNLGPNWLHNFEYRLLRSGDTAEVLTQQGRKILFQNSTGSWSLQNGGGAPFQLVSEGDLYVFGDPISQRVFVFNTGGQLIRIEDGKGNAHTLTYTGNVLTAVSDGLGRELTFTYVSLQQLFQVTSGIRSVRFSYGANMELLTVRDPVNNPVNYQYQNTAMGPLLLSKSLPMGNSHLTNRYDPMGRIESQRDAYGNLFAYRFDPGLTTVTNPLGGTEQHVHNSQNQLVTVTDEAGRSIHLGYDTNGNRTSIQDREGGVTLISYHPSGKPAAITNADHTVVRYAYSPRTYRGITFHDLARTDYPDGTFESYGRDAAGNILFLTNRQGSVRTFTYNNRGQVLTARNPTGGVTDYAYNTNGTLASISREGNSVTLAYDALGRLVQEQHPDGTRRLYARDLLDRVVRMTNELGGILEYQYDANGNQISRNHPGEALEHEHGFDKMDRLSSFMAPGGVMSLLQFDALGRTAAIIHDGGRTNRFSYDAVGNVTEIEDAEGSVWRFAYDAEGVVTQKINPLNKTNLFVTDAMGRVTTHTSAKGNSRQIEYDSMGQLRVITAPDGLKTTLEYENSLLKSLTVGTNGLQNIFAYNPLGRETEQKDPAGSFWRQEFDSHGRRTAAIDPLGRRTEYQYDTRGRASRVTFPGSLGSVQIEYDGLNAITRRLYSDGNDLRYEYDRKGQLTNATGVTLERDHSGLITRCNGIEISRTSQKQINTITYAAGKIVTYAYNKRNQVVTMDDWLGGRYFF